MKKITLIILIISSWFSIYAQDIPQGAWRTHFSYQNARIIETTANKVFCAVENGLFYVDTEDNTVNILGKLDGLSDVTISAMGYSQASETLVIGYENGNIDLFSGNGTFNIDLLLDQNLIQDKAIRDIHIRDQSAFLSTDFGIVVVDLERQEIDQVYREIGPNGVQPEVSATVTLADSIFALTNIGLLRSRISDNINLLDFNNWELTNTPSSITFNLADANNEQLLFGNQQNLFTYDEGNFVEVSNSLTDISKISLTTENRIFLISDGISYEIENGVISRITDDENLVNQQDIVLFRDQFWLADGSIGLFQINTGNVTSLSPSGPLTDQIERIVFENDSVLVFGPAGNDGQMFYSVFNNNGWTNQSISGFSNPNDLSGTFLSSGTDGIYNIDLQEVLTNTPFVADQITGQTIITDIEEFRGALWVANPNTNLPLHVRGQDGIWISFNLNGRAPDIAQIAVSGNIWARNSNGNGGIIVLNPAETNTMLVNTSNSDLPSAVINDITIDLDNEVWVATNGGVAFFPSASADISNFNNAILPIFENNFLFRDEVINSIAVDPGNRKWIGNQRGAWLLEEAGESLVTRFTAENSPLPSNNVLQIAINGNNGETFFVTDRGTVSFRSDATNSSAIHGDVKIFPNPVTPGFSGLVGINGLATDVRIKITDISGKLIRELEANGGASAWDLRDINGNRAQSGVYLFFSSDSEGQETFVGKIAVVN